MLRDLTSEERLLLLRFLCAFAWTDLTVKDGEKRFIQRLMRRLELAEDDRQQVEQWLHVAPAPSGLDPSQIPEPHRRTFIEAIRALIYSDGQVDDEERASFEKLRQALS